MTSFSERVSYWVYFTGQAFSYSLMVLVLPTYLLMIGIDVAKIALLMFGVKIWDAVNDAIFGIIFDKVKFKSGMKCLPWLKITVFFIPCSTMLMYLIPSGLGQMAKLIWFTVAYILWDTAYTISDVPIYSFVTSMTSNLKERNSILTTGRIFASLGVGAYLISNILVSESVGMSFTMTAGIISIFMTLLLIPIAVKGKERIRPEETQEETYTLKSMVGYLKTNKHLLYFYMGYILNGVCNTSATVEMFVSYYLFGNAMFATLMYVISIAPMAVVALFINKLIRKFDKFKLYRNCTIMLVVIGVIIYAAGYKNIYIYAALVLLRSIPMAITGIMSLTFTPDCVEYGKYKTGVDARGVSFAIQSFATKFSSVNQSLAMFILGIFGWIAIDASSFDEIKALGIMQPESALNGLWVTYALVPVIGAALSLIPLAFYKLNDRDLQIMAKYNSGEITREEAENSMTRKY